MKNFPSIRRLQMFEALGRTLNFRQTADEAGLAQPALSRGIRQLEEELGLRLFERTTRTTRLSPAGQWLHQRMQPWLEELDRCLEQARQLAHGNQPTINLAYSAQASNGCMSRRLFQFGLHHPGVALNLQLLSSEAAYAQLASGAIHGAFVLIDRDALTGLGLDHVPVEVQRVVALCAAGHPLAQAGSISAAQLTQWDFAIGNEARWKIFRTKVFAALQSMGVSIRVAYEADDTPLLLEAIAQGSHVGLYGEGIVQQLPASLKHVALDFAIELPIGYAYHPQGGPHSLALAQFLAQP